MKRYLYIALPLLAAAATPALATEAKPLEAPAAASGQRTADRQAMSEQVREGLARLRKALNAGMRDTKQRAQATRHEANGRCTDCPAGDAAADLPSVSDDHKADCPECVEHAVYA